jgi:prepilin-type N-terminal cleavage/methylation domain-containing protein
MISVERIRRPAGFTLVELIIAMMLLAAATAVMMPLMVSVSAQRRREQRRRVVLAENLLDDLLAPRGTTSRGSCRTPSPESIRGTSKLLLWTSERAVGDRPAGRRGERSRYAATANRAGTRPGPPLRPQIRPVGGRHEPVAGPPAARKPRDNSAAAAPSRPAAGWSAFSPSGWTLLELMVAISVLAVVMTVSGAVCRDRSGGTHSGICRQTLAG